MPRDGSNIYHRPPGTDGIPNTTIASTPYNGYVADVEQDLNLPRPIVAGGTGAANAHDAMVALSGEIAKQIVTNYDSFPWVNGSFYSAAGATSAPNPTNRFAGIYYGNADDSYATVEARDQTTGIKYVRKKVAGVWDATWAAQAGSVADLDAAYVNVAGDAMSGSLSAPNFLAVTTATTGGYYFGTSGTKYLQYDGINYNLVGGPLSVGVLSSGLLAGDICAARSASTGYYFFGFSGKFLGYDGANFSLVGGSLTVNSAINATGDLIAGAAGVAGVVRFGNTGAKYLYYDGTNFNLTGGPLYVNSTVYSAVTPTTGTYYFGNSGTKYLNYDGANFSLVGGQFRVNTDIMVGASGTIGICYFGNTSTKYLNYDSINFNLVGGGLIAMPYYFVVGGTQRASISHNGASWNFFSDSSQGVGQYMLPGGNTWVSFSDARLPYKVNAEQINNVLDRLAGVNLYTNIGPSGEREVFFKAQELALSLPELVAEPKGPQSRDASYLPTGPGDPSGWGVMYDRASSVALQAVKELLARVEALEKRLQEAA